MRKFLLMFCVGLAAGYFVGFRDAQTNETHAVARLVERAGGSHRDNMKTDIDTEMGRLER